MRVFSLEFVGGADGDRTFKYDCLAFGNLGKDFVNDRDIVFFGDPVKGGGNADENQFGIKSLMFVFGFS